MNMSERRPRTIHMLQPHDDAESGEESDNSGFETAISAFSNATYHTAISGIGTKQQSMRRPLLDAEYATVLLKKLLLPVDPAQEQNWSGRGQHVEFEVHEKATLTHILEVQDTLGSTSCAIVQSVKCKRILLARKTIRCSRHFTKDQAIDEVAHLTRLSHSHIVQVIGTYTLGNDLSILMYPVADCNLETFLEELHLIKVSKKEWEERIISLLTGLPCLCNAMLHIHTNMTKHMDIKPKNILVRNVRHYKSPRPRNASFKFYIADFGISRSYGSLEDSETEGPTMFTRRYAAPEVVEREKRGLAADIFSLGCVFVEIYSVIARKFEPWARQNQDASFPDVAWIMSCKAYEEALYDQLSDDSLISKLRGVLVANEFGDTSYQANINPVQQFLSTVGRENPLYSKPIQEVIRMINANPQERPTAKELATYWGRAELCCTLGRDELEAMSTVCERR